MIAGSHGWSLWEAGAQGPEVFQSILRQEDILDIFHEINKFLCFLPCSIRLQCGNDDWKASPDLESFVTCCIEDDSGFESIRHFNPHFSSGCGGDTTDSCTRVSYGSDVVETVALGPTEE